MTTIVTLQQRLAEPRGARILIVGPFGVGKTSLLRTLNSGTALFIDVENGAMAIDDFPVPHIRPQTWSEVRDVIVRIAGPNRSFLPQEPFSELHFNSVGGFLPELDRYETIFLDTITSAARLCFRHASQQPEAFNDRGKLDLRGVYGAHARELLLALHQLQSARGKNIILIGALETVTDEYGRVEHKLQAEGQRVPREILGIVDVVITMNFVDFGDGKLVRALICNGPNVWQFPAKDRSGKLDQVESPDLGKLIQKILPPRANHAGGEVGQPDTIQFTKQA